MRPDRLVVGEVRGPEIVELLSALNTGHEGGCGTIHANSAEDVPARIEALGLTAGLDRTSVHALLGAGLDAIVHLTRERSGLRVVSGIHSLVRDDLGMVRVRPALSRREGVMSGEAGLLRLMKRVEDAGVPAPR